MKIFIAVIYIMFTCASIVRAQANPPQATPPATQPTEIPLKSIYSTSHQADLHPAPNAPQINVGDGGGPVIFGFTWGKDFDALSNSKLIPLVATDSSALVLDRPADDQSQLWAVVYFGSMGSQPPQVIIDSVKIGADGNFTVNFHPVVGGISTMDLYPYIAWIPLGPLPAGKYSVSLVRGGETVIDRKFSIADAAAPAPATMPSPAPADGQRPSAAIPFDTFTGYFVSNQFEPNKAQSFVILKDQKSFDDTFGVAMVMGDRSHRLPAGAFDKNLVIATIDRGTGFREMKANTVKLDAGVLTLDYSASAPNAADTATYACPLIISVSNAQPIKSVNFVKNGKLVKTLAMP